MGLTSKCKICGATTFIVLLSINSSVSLVCEKCLTKEEPHSLEESYSASNFGGLIRVSSAVNGTSSIVGMLDYPGTIFN
jgi:ribosome-binding protein aMBF1 (putative translation factor)